MLKALFLFFLENNIYFLDREHSWLNVYSWKLALFMDVNVQDVRL